MESNIKQGHTEEKSLNKYWQDFEYKIQYENEHITLKEAYTREVEKNNGIFQKINKLTNETIPTGKYILFVNSTKRSLFDNPDSEGIAKDRIQMMFEADTGLESVPPTELLDRTIEHKLGFPRNDSRFKPFHIFDQEISELKLDENCVGVVFSGSEINVHDTDETHKEPLLKAKYIFNQFRDKHIPILGICFGAQMIANEFGTKIKWTESKDGARHKSFGPEKIIINSSTNTEFADFAKETYVLESHAQSIDVPTLTSIGGNVIAVSNLNNAEIYTISDNILATQFHPEASPIRMDIALSLLGDYSPENTFMHDTSLVREKIFEFFLNRIRNRKDN